MSQRQAAVEAGDAEGVLKGAKAGDLQSFNWEHVGTELDNSDSRNLRKFMILQDFSLMYRLPFFWKATTKVTREQNEAMTDSSALVFLPSSAANGQRRFG